MKKVMLVLVLLGLNSMVFGLSIDGDKSDWEAAGLLKNDPVGDHVTLNGGGAADITRWGVTAEGGFVYTMIEDPLMDVYFTSGKCFPGVFIDVDRVGGYATYGTVPGSTKTGWNGPSLLGTRDSVAYPEFSTPVPTGGTGRGAFDGTDVCVEWGVNAEGFNFWGNATTDSMEPQGSAVSTALGGATAHASGSTFIEYRIPISQIISEVKSYPDYNAGGVKMDITSRVWKAAVRINGKYNDAYSSDISGDALAAVNYPGYTPTESYVTWVYVLAGTIYGDCNEDGTVNYADFTTLKQNFGKAADDWSDGDFNANGVVDYADFVSLKGNFGKSYTGPWAEYFGAASAPAGVPEPATMSMLVLGGLALLRRRAK